MKRWEKLAEIIKKHDLHNFIEIGTDKGQNIRNLLKLLKDYPIDITCVDPYENYPGFAKSPLADKKKLRRAKQKVYDTILKDPRVTLIEKYSEDVIPELEDESVDICFIDGNHFYEYVDKDIKMMYPKIRPGGFITGHDYRKEKPGVIKAVDEFLEREDLDIYYTNGQKSWYVRKPGGAK